MSVMARRAVRAEIQALRALAVGLVVVYHEWPSSLPGGFTGVDVFFVISGFLITSNLLRESNRSRRVSLAAFWARRARRILPAALLVLLTCAIATTVLVPELLRQQFLAEIRAGALYVQNWHLAAASVDYARADDGPSLVQHFWSLSVEEQFYLVWPLLITAALLVTRGRTPASARRLLAIALSSVTALSLAYSIHATATDPATAYFATPPRAWEFGAGGLLALIPTCVGSRVRLRAVASWAGLAAIVTAALAYSEAPTPLLRQAPLQFIGDNSYSIYLWHWPLLILAPFVLHRAVDAPVAIGILALTLVAAWLTKTLVEDPLRTGRFFIRRSNRWTFALAGAGTIAVLSVSAAGVADVERQIQVAERHTRWVVAHQPSCFGAAAVAYRHCTHRNVAGVVPTPLEARRALNSPCSPIAQRDLVYVCAFGKWKAQARDTVALIGDSHASHWRAALEVVAQAKRWRGLSVTHSSCPFSTAVRNLPEPQRSQCVRWNREVLAWLREHPDVRTVFVSELSRSTFLAGSRAQADLTTEIDGYISAWRAMPRTVKHIVVIRDTPEMLDRSRTLICVEHAIAQHRRPGRACARPRSEAVLTDPAALAAARLRSPRVQLIDMTSLFCDRRWCPPVIGGALVYKDMTHLTSVYATTLGRFLLPIVDRLAAAWQPRKGRPRLT
jgi:peptidoglycan/LPS O-acetylase OafA/YrhL